MNAQAQATALNAWLRAALRPGAADALSEPSPTPEALGDEPGLGRPLGEGDAFWAAAGARHAQEATAAVLDICAQGCRYQKACREGACGLYRIEQAARRSLSAEPGLQ